MVLKLLQFSRELSDAKSLDAGKDILYAVNFVQLRETETCKVNNLKNLGLYQK